MRQDVFGLLVSRSSDVTLNRPIGLDILMALFRCASFREHVHIIPIFALASVPFAFFIAYVSPSTTQLREIASLTSHEWMIGIEK